MHHVSQELAFYSLSKLPTVVGRPVCMFSPKLLVIHDLETSIFATFYHLFFRLQELARSSLQNSEIGSYREKNADMTMKLQVHVFVISCWLANRHVSCQTSDLQPVVFLCTLT